MKYLKTFEAHKKYTLRLDRHLLHVLIGKAIDSKQYGTVKDILDSGFKDATNFFLNNIIGYSPDIKILQLLIDYGADVNIIYSGKPIIQHVFSRQYRDQTKLKVIRLLIKNGADLFLKSRDQEDFFDNFLSMTINGSAIKTSFKDKYKELALDIVKEESPEQYKKYLMKKDAEKYNL